jgi:hypothetical protein
MVPNRTPFTVELILAPHANVGDRLANGKPAIANFVKSLLECI